MAETAQMLELLRKAVILKLQGASWHEVAAACERSDGTCVNWPVVHRESWNRIWHELSPDIEIVMKQRGQSAMAILEKLAYSTEDERIKAQCAKALADLAGKTIVNKQDIKHGGDGIKIYITDGGIRSEGDEGAADE